MAHGLNLAFWPRSSSPQTFVLLLAIVVGLPAEAAGTPETTAWQCQRQKPLYHSQSWSKRLVQWAVWLQDRASDPPTGSACAPSSPACSLSPWKSLAMVAGPWPAVLLQLFVSWWKPGCWQLPRSPTITARTGALPGFASSAAGSASDPTPTGMRAAAVGSPATVARALTPVTAKGLLPVVPVELPISWQKSGLWLPVWERAITARAAALATVSEFQLSVLLKLPEPQLPPGCNLSLQEAQQLQGFAHCVTAATSALVIIVVWVATVGCPDAVASAQAPSVVV